MSASPPLNVAPPMSSVSSNPATSPADSEPPYDQITTLFRTLKKLLHINFDLRGRQTAYNKKRQYKVYSQLRRKTRAICQLMRSKEAALSLAQLSQLAQSICLLRMKEFALHADSTLHELTRVITRLHRERQEGVSKASQAVVENTTSQGNSRSHTIRWEGDTAEHSSGARVSGFVMPVSHDLRSYYQ